ncbi:NUDIX domain-containing protein [Polaromonas sp. YR568]|uniref:NUDIX hydrolase n=1 Tax=Polaromonas sp. YR568 TaxID=1855301 RepID=UPI003137CB3A
MRLDPDWLASVRARASQSPVRPRVPLWAGEAQIGSVEPGFLRQPALRPLSEGPHAVLQERGGEHSGWYLLGDVTASLDRVACALREVGLSGAWRDEQLAVNDQHGQRQGTVERAAVRLLGIATHAVHLVGVTSDGRVWVQQRAFNKPTDPGLWDTLVGGMVPADETLDNALARETWEEAGLRLGEMQALRQGGRLTVCKPSSDGAGAGYMREEIDWSLCTVPDGITPINQDGEVAQFALMEREELVHTLQRDSFTLEAALMLAEVINRKP